MTGAESGVATGSQPVTGVALVTGAASGIGAAIAADLAAAGYRVAGFDLRPSSTDLPLTGDVTDASAVARAVSEAERALGPLDVLVTAAGFYEMIPFSEITPQQWQRMLSVHLGGVENFARAVLPGMTRRRAGNIVAISSELGVGGGDTDAHYAAAKGAIIGLVRSLAAEVAPDGVRVNSVAPGPTDTPMNPPDSPWRDPGYLATLPARRLATPAEIAEAVRFVLGNSFLVGEVVSVNSGAVI
jgi:2-hydroxycyclohexanecarboxyl-CoA dehydrogenase